MCVNWWPFCLSLNELKCLDYETYYMKIVHVSPTDYNIALDEHW